MEKMDPTTSTKTTVIHLHRRIIFESYAVNFVTSHVRVIFLRFGRELPGVLTLAPPLTGMELGNFPEL